MDANTKNLRTWCGWVLAYQLSQFAIGLLALFLLCDLIVADRTEYWLALPIVVLTVWWLPLLHKIRPPVYEPEPYQCPGAQDLIELTLEGDLASAMVLTWPPNGYRMISPHDTMQEGDIVAGIEWRGPLESGSPLIGLTPGVRGLACRPQK